MSKRLTNLIVEIILFIYKYATMKKHNYSFENLLEMKTCFGNTVIFLWVMAITFFPLSCGKGCSEEQNRALLEIRNSTNGLAFADWDGRNCEFHVTVEMGELALSLWTTSHQVHGIQM
jgi:hypothetical protein